ncbi:hypothetical protein M2140_000233 [Clostridiales Family XIII bacterium PM5-7]
MRKFNYFCSIVLVVLLPIMIVVLSSNLIVRMSEPYVYHFNDSQVVNEIPFNVTGAEIASSIADYWSPFEDKDFQVYETNGAYKEPIFVEEEQEIMAKAKVFLNIELAIGVAALIISALIYIYLWRKGFKKALRNRFYVSAGVTVALLIIQGVCWYMKPFRAWLYDSLIGIKLTEASMTLQTILSGSFFQTYVLFATILGVAVLAVLTYINYKLTKPERIFY